MYTYSLAPAFGAIIACCLVTFAGCSDHSRQARDQMMIGDAGSGTPDAQIDSELSDSVNREKVILSDEALGRRPSSSTHLPNVDFGESIAIDSELSKSERMQGQEIQPLRLQNRVAQQTESSTVFEIPNSDLIGIQGRSQKGFAAGIGAPSGLDINSVANARSKDHDTQAWLSAIRGRLNSEKLQGLEFDGTQLISLGQFGRPRVYLGDTIPSMESLKKVLVGSRALSDLESQALEQVKAGDEFVFTMQENKQNAIGMLALRADADCRSCHESAEGELLGALAVTYRQDKQPESE